MSKVPAISLAELEAELRLGKVDEFWNALTDAYFPHSGQAVQKLQAFGYTNARAYEGGLAEWETSGKAIDRQAA